MVDARLDEEAAQGAAWEERQRRGAQEPMPSDATWRLLLRVAGAAPGGGASPAPSLQNARLAVWSLLLQRFRRLAQVVLHRQGYASWEAKVDDVAHEVICASLDPFDPQDPSGDGRGALPVSVALPRRIAARLRALYRVAPRQGPTRTQVSLDVTESVPCSPAPVADDGGALSRAAAIVRQVEHLCPPRARAIAKLVRAGRARSRVEIPGREYADLVCRDIDRYRWLRDDEIADLFRVVRRNRPTGWGRRMPLTQPTDARWLAAGACAVLASRGPATARRHVMRLLGLDDTSVSEAVVAFEDAAREAQAALTADIAEDAAGPDPQLSEIVMWFLEVGP